MKRYTLRDLLVDSILVTSILLMALIASPFILASWLLNKVTLGTYEESYKEWL